MNDSMIKVAVADDNPGMRQYVAEAVNESRDMKMVGEATDGEALLELVKVARPDIVLADLLMPHYDGYMFIEKIRNMVDMVPPDIMIISAVSKMCIRDRSKGNVPFCGASGVKKVQNLILRVVLTGTGGNITDCGCRSLHFIQLDPMAHMLSLIHIFHSLLAENCAFIIWEAYLVHRKKAV